ncbi:MAG TPA: hypothetical protein VF395_03420, partial [Polyangiaceae bacterium]
MTWFASLLLGIQILGLCTGCSSQSASSDGTHTNSAGTIAPRGSATSTGTAGGGATSRGEGVVTRDAGRIQAHIRVASVRPGDED